MPTLATLPTAPTVIRVIPNDQLAAWNRETEAARRYVQQWVDRLHPLQGIRGREKFYPQIARQMRCSVATVKRKWGAWSRGLEGRCSPAWEDLIDRSRFPAPADRQLDARFLDHWTTTVERQSRQDGMKQALRVLLGELHLWEKDPLDLSLKIPGYDAPPSRDSYCSVVREYVPDGWSYSNLRHHKPSSWARKNMLVGPGAASALLPGNLQTRFGLRYREIVFSDDQYYDNQTVSVGNRGESMRPLGFNTLDYLTANFETWGVRLTRRDEESGKKRSLDQEDYVWTVLLDLMRHGYRDEECGTTLIRELGTAKGYERLDGFGESFDDSLYAVSGGRVRVDHSGRFNAHLLAQVYHTGTGKQAKGNSRRKAPLESAFHRVRTACAGLLGSTGNNARLDPPELMAADEKQVRYLWRELGKHPTHLQGLLYDMLTWPKHQWEHFGILLDLAYRATGSRTDHALEGWAKCGFVLPGYEVEGDRGRLVYSAAEVARMEPQRREYIERFGTDRRIVLSPADAAAICRHSDRHILRKLDREASVSLLPLAWAYPIRQGGKHTQRGIKVQPNGTLRVRDMERFGDETLEYRSLLHDGRDRRELPEGKQFLLHICPFDPSEALVRAMDGRFLGWVQLNQRSRANDREAILRSLGATAEMRGARERDQRRRHAETIASREAEVARNAEILADPESHLDPLDIAAERLRIDREAAQAAHDRGEVTVEPDPSDYIPGADLPDDDTDSFERLAFSNSNQPTDPA